MKKTVAGLLLLAIVCIATVPYWFGVQSEKSYRQYMDRLAQSPNIEVDRSDYKRGWWSSVADIEIRIPRLAMQASLTHDIEHGPFPLTGFTQRILAFDPVQAVIYSQGTVHSSRQDGGSSSPLSVHTRVDMLANTVSRLDLPSGESHTNSGQRLLWKRVNGEFSSTSGGDSLTGWFESDGVTIDADGGNLEVGAITIEFDMNKGTSGLSLGEAIIRTEQLAIRGSENSDQDVSINDLRYITSSGESNGLAQLSMLTELGHATYSGVRYGPGTLSLVLKDMQAKQLAQFQAGAREGSITLNEILLALSTGQPKVEANLEFQTEDGPVSGVANLVVNGSQVGNMGVFGLLSAINAVAELGAPGPIVSKMLALGARRKLRTLEAQGKLEPPSPEQESIVVAALVDQQLQGLLAQKQLVQDGDRLVLKTVFRDGQLTMNGEPVGLFGSGR
ncbi:MAG: YdgA family protein [Gammaproteobacteria bacterium]|nr:YdgA family protein [Gammaproteobacteria bacterium]